MLSSKEHLCISNKNSRMASDTDDFVNLEGLRIHFRARIDNHNPFIRIRLYIQRWFCYSSNLWGQWTWFFENNESATIEELNHIFHFANIIIVYPSQTLPKHYIINQQLVSGGGGTNSPLASEISNLEESSYKVGRLSVEERKEKIHRYMKKRNERNFSKKIKYACRKTLADSRPRVRGRFAKNDDFGETARTSGSNQDDEDDEVVGKEEDDMVDSSDIFAHISGVNSFKCNYPLQSWI